jgi:hypothetical protein
MHRDLLLAILAIWIRSNRDARRREMRHMLSLGEFDGVSLRPLSESAGIPAGILSWWSHHLLNSLL